jgi:hypothetical protein
MSKIKWTERQWDYFFSLEICFKKLVCTELLAGEDALKTLKWVVGSIYGYRINLDEISLV